MKTDFDRDLQNYVLSTQTRTDAGEGTKADGGSRWLRYSAAAGSALALASAADAGVIYSGLKNISVSATNGTSSAAIDLDGDGLNELTIGVRNGGGTSWWTSPATSSKSAFVNGNQIYWSVNQTWWGTNNNNAELLLNTTGNVQQLSSGATISSGPFGYGKRLLRGTDSWWTASGTWNNSVTAFAGLKFEIGGNDHFGWIQLHIDGVSSGGTPKITAINWAYESEAGVAIRAGAGIPVPEPATHALFLLGGGAMGLAAWRRRRKTAARDLANQ